jgi:hypothetical protein
MRVKEVMTPAVEVIQADSTLQAAARMKARDIGPPGQPGPSPMLQARSLLPFPDAALARHSTFTPRFAPGF